MNGLTDEVQPPALRERVVPFTAGDGRPLRLTQIRADRPPYKGPVLLAHGAGVRGNIFRPPTPTHFVRYLVGQGYDVWLEEWRASIDLPANEWTLDQAALYDHPAAVRTVVRETGARGIQAVIHCQGSTSFMMSALAGLVPEVTTIVSNAVSLDTVIPHWANFKIQYAVPVVAKLTPYLNPQWGLGAPTVTARAIDLFVKATHHECNNPVCKWASFTYGSGFPTLWRHENLTDATHTWITQEFGAVPFTFFRQMARCVRRGHLVSYDHPHELPADFTARPPRTEARFAFFAGALNACFLPEGQQRTFDRFNAWRPGYHSLHVVPEYGHLDMFLGTHAARDVFPLMLEELERKPDHATIGGK